MIKDVIFNLPLVQRDKADYAISIASAFEAHITGTAFVYEAIVPVPGDINPDIVEAQQRENEDAAKNAAKRFTDAAARAGVSADALTLNVEFGDVGRRFGVIARCFDLAVVGQAEPGKDTAETTIVEGALFETGRPVAIVPYIQKAPLKLDNVMVCWDGSRSAARAVADSMPFLERAGRVEIVTVTNERGKLDRVIEGVDIATHLARHGLNVTVNRMPVDEIDVGNALLSHAADSDADFMVMGGYGHSRLREFVLGGVTRSILSSMTVPVLMSH